MRPPMPSIRLLLLATCLSLAAAPCLATPCVEPDNGSGTVDMPPLCPEGYLGVLTIIDGLPPGSTITGPAALRDIVVSSRVPEGPLGAEYQYFSATLYWEASGTGDLAGFTRTLAIPVGCDTYTGPRTPGDPVQIFVNEMMLLEGHLFGDPDFCALDIVAGGDFGLPSPGQTTLTELPSGDFNVDSFFDINYRIDFEGCPGSILEGLSGSTIDTERFQAGETYFPPVDHNCQLPDDGTGTVALPPACPDGYLGALTIIDGLPPGTTITGPAVLTDFVVNTEGPGGLLGGDFQIFDAQLHWQATGDGDLAGFSRSLVIPVTGETHFGPRNPGDPEQFFAGDVFRLQGELFGDPDFCVLRIRAGTDLGLPGPGQTTLTQLPSGDFAVDSFFDITYQIEFEGCPASPIQDLSGTTTGIERYHAGETYFPPVDHDCVLPDDGTGTVALPPACPDGYLGALTIIDGLPPGTTITGPAVLTDFVVTTEGPGGLLGGDFQIFDAQLHWQATGDGYLAGFSRSLVIPVTGETHFGPRVPGDPVQEFMGDVYWLHGELFGDPDFCFLRVRAGTDLGLPSPGQTSLTRLPSGDFAVDSFFDITYQIEFEGCPASPIQGLSGTTTATERYHAGEPFLVGVDGPPAARLGVLRQNAPNPFNPVTTIRYELPPGGARVALQVYDMRGRHVVTLVDGRQEGGPHAVAWDGRDAAGRSVSSGVYFCALKTERGVLTRKMALIE